MNAGKIIVFKNETTGQLTYESMGSHTPEEVYLKRFPGSFVTNISDLPTDKTFSAALKLSKTGNISTDLKKAREIMRQNIRNDRHSSFAVLDREFVEALSQDKDLTQIKAKQKLLRDEPNDPRIDKATTLKSLMTLEKSRRIKVNLRNERGGSPL